MALRAEDERNFRFRTYLRIPVRKHRRALTQLLTSDHCLAIERLRRTDRHHARLPREERLCRFCHEAIEDPLHVLFQCDAHGDFGLQRDRLRAALQVNHCDAMMRRWERDGVSDNLILAMTRGFDSAACFAAFVHAMLTIVESVPIYRI